LLQTAKYFAGELRGWAAGAGSALTPSDLFGGFIAGAQPLPQTGLNPPVPDCLPVVSVHHILSRPHDEMKLKRNSFKTVSKQFQNCSVSASFRCADGIRSKPSEKVTRFRLTHVFVSLTIA